MKIKFCGLKTKEDYICAWELGVDFVGFMCYKNSPRYISPDDMRAVIASTQTYMNKKSHIPKAPQTVGVFVDGNKDDILHIINTAHIDIAQIYDESIIDILPIEYWKVRSIKEKTDVSAIINMKEAMKQTPQWGAVLLDKKTDALLGGSGKQFNWNYLKHLDFEMPCFIAGGINRDTIQSLLPYRPYGLDISSGIERVRGKKDHALMREMVSIIRNFYGNI